MAAWLASAARPALGHAWVLENVLETSFTPWLACLVHVHVRMCMHKLQRWGERALGASPQGFSRKCHLSGASDRVASGSGGSILRPGRAASREERRRRRPSAHLQTRAGWPGRSGAATPKGRPRKCLPSGASARVASGSVGSILRPGSAASREERRRRRPSAHPQDSEGGSSGVAGEVRSGDPKGSVPQMPPIGRIGPGRLRVGRLDFEAGKSRQPRGTPPAAAFRSSPDTSGVAGEVRSGDPKGSPPQMPPIGRIGPGRLRVGRLNFEAGKRRQPRGTPPAAAFRSSPGLRGGVKRGGRGGPERRPQRVGPANASYQTHRPGSPPSR